MPSFHAIPTRMRIHSLFVSRVARYAPERRFARFAMLLLVAAGSVAPVNAQVAHPRVRTATTKVAAVDVVEATVTELSNAMANGTTTSLALVNAYLARIAAYDHAGPSLNALILLSSTARKEAAQLDSERRAGHVRGPLHGIPVIIKDNYDTGDMPTSAGSLALANSRPAQDAFVVKQLRAAGAVVIAKSNLHELASGITSISSLGGQTRNPYDPARCPGGSSGGTGAAIAASFATVGWGSDTCGSIRIPSAFGSLFGLRPTQGFVSRNGIVPLSHTQDIGGPLARTATDLAIALDVTVGYDPADSVTQILRGTAAPRFVAGLNRTALQGARIGVFRPYFADADAEIADTVRAALSAMRAQGATLIDIAPAEFDTLIANTTVLNMETKFDLLDYLAKVPDAPVHSLREIIDRGEFDRALEMRFRTVDTFSTRESAARTLVLKRQGLLRARLQRIMDSLSLDALAYPTMRQKPVLIGEIQTGQTCALSAQSGLPAISLPAGFTTDGLPVGIELLGRALSDTQLVALAYSFEQSGPRRRAPFTTPALVRGVTPVALPVTMRVATSVAAANAQFTYDATKGGTLRWSVSVTGTASDVSAVVLRRTSSEATQFAPTGAKRVIARLLGPGMQSGNGLLTLNAVERAAWREGRLSLAVYSRTGAMAEREIPPHQSPP
ncbi:MAG: amidase family protein [Gemmatimonadota bacterium]|nr:amidase family protein [Gemmatimonadota bacterium]